MANKVRFAVIGCGVISKFHAVSINQIENAELVACFDAYKPGAERFAAEYGVTPHAYLARIRADVGAELLRRTDMSVAEIAAEAGFADTSEFFRCFRNIHGTAPTKYRQAATASTDRTSADASGTRTASRP